MPSPHQGKWPSSVAVFCLSAKHLLFLTDEIGGESMTEHMRAPTSALKLAALRLENRLNRAQRAFAAQVLACLKAPAFDPYRLT